MGWFSDALFGERKQIDESKLDKYMKPTQDLVTEQLDMSRQMMDPNSQMNLNMRNMMSQRAGESGAMQGQQQRALAAQSGMSAGQSMMNQQMGMSQSMGGVENQFQSMMGQQMGQGRGLMGQMTGMQQGLNENQANAYVQKINAHNARRAQNQQFLMDAGATAAMAFSDKRLKKNIELVGKSDKGYNIYEFEYKDKGFGPDRYRGVMAQEVPFASMEDSNGYLFVNYSHPDLDIEFERIS